MWGQPPLPFSSTLCRRAPAVLLLILFVSLAVPLSASVDGAGGWAVEGSDAARMLPPAGAAIESYTNAGYSLDYSDGEAEVSVSLEPLGSYSPFHVPVARENPDPIFRLSRALTLNAATELEAVSRVLSWVARNITYRLDRRESQSADEVLERRAGYCTGIARLTVTMLDSIGIEAREVAGFVYSSDESGPSGYHRWIETRYKDVGWVFSDPHFSHHYVPAGYLRLASERLQVSRGLEGVLLERRDSVTVVDLSPAAGPGIRARRNSERRLAAALQISVESRARGLAVLEGDSRRRTHTLVNGQATFLGLEPGHYRLQVMLAGRGVVERRVELVGRQRATLNLAASFHSGRAGTDDSTPTMGDLE